MKLADKVAEFRKAAGMSQAELAEKVGVTQGFISHIEANTRKPTLGLLQRLADALGVAPQDLLDEKRPTSRR